MNIFEDPEVFDRRVKVIKQRIASALRDAAVTDAETLEARRQREIMARLDVELPQALAVQREAHHRQREELALHLRRPVTARDCLAISSVTGQLSNTPWPSPSGAGNVRPGTAGQAGEQLCDQWSMEVDSDWSVDQEGGNLDEIMTSGPPAEDKAIRTGDRFQCPRPRCPRTYSTERALNVHIRRYHNQEKPHSCEHCDKSFFSKWELSQHQFHC